MKREQDENKGDGGRPVPRLQPRLLPGERAVSAQRLHRRRFKKLIEALKLPALRFYDLRQRLPHGSRRCRYPDRPRIVGHSNSVITLKSYVHDVPGTKAIAMQRLEAFQIVRQQPYEHGGELRWLQRRLGRPRRRRWRRERRHGGLWNSSCWRAMRRVSSSPRSSRRFQPKASEVSRGSRGARKDGRVIYSVLGTDGKNNAPRTMMAAGRIRGPLPSTGSLPYAPVFRPLDPSRRESPGPCESLTLRPDAPGSGRTTIPASSSA